MPKQSSFSYKLTKPQQDSLEQILRTGNYRPMQMEHTRIAARAEDCTVALYKSGKCLIQGKGSAEFVTFVMEPLVLGTAQLGYEEVLDPDSVQPHMGVDESGKGDFFGPLVVVAAYSDAELLAKMREMNVRDSKNISSDNVALGMGRELRKMLGSRFAVVKVGAAAYNRLYANIRNVNRLLAWGHARSIENLLEVVPGCPRALSDQFGSKEQVEKALMQKGSKIVLEQKHRAESDLAVAAASVIARELFLRSLKDLGDKYGVEFPKGASARVKEMAIELVKKHGPKVLLETAKCHFKTTDAVLAAAGSDRKELGPEGQAVSKTTNFRRKKG
ncbi:MAG: ribonuclease HIII [Lentisphaerae bacterium]|nr:ribonuclease HIII [Lentisphaerota bacterium]